MPADRQARTIGHALFTYDDGAGLAFRGQTVQLTEADIARGEQFGAFSDGQPEPYGNLEAFPANGSEVEQVRWLKDAKVEEAVDEAGRRPEVIAAMLAAEQSRGTSARKTLLGALSAVASSSPTPGPAASRPADDADRDDWAAYALTLGATESDLDGQNRDYIRDLVDLHTASSK